MFLILIGLSLTGAFVLIAVAFTLSKPQVDGLAARVRAAQAAGQPTPGLVFVMLKSWIKVFLPVFFCLSRTSSPKRSVP